VGRAEALVSTTLVASVILWSGVASAFCRTTTCDAANPDANCQYDANHCSLTGSPLFWGTACIGFGVQKDGSPLRHVTYKTFDGIVRTAFNQWTASPCSGGGHPSFRMWDLGPIECGEPEFNQKTSPNANVWMMRDGDWPYQGQFATLALTTVSFSLRTGEIYDADVEINSHTIPNLTTSDTSVGSDLQSIVTHEAGHFLGLAHSPDRDATMNANYSSGDLSFRTLSPDDQAGICAAYPTDRKVAQCSAPATPRNGFSVLCGADSDGSTSAGSGPSATCSLPARGLGGPASSTALGGLVGLGLLARAVRRRRR
jgi:hypothetical protein